MASAWGNSWGSAWGNAWGAITAAVSGGSSTAKGSNRRIHPRWIREDEESELPEVIQRKTKLTKKVEKLLKKAPAEVLLDPVKNRAELGAELAKAEAAIQKKLSDEIDEEDDWLLLMA